MKIFFVNQKHGFFGGIEQVIYETALALRERGHLCYLAYAQNEKKPNVFEKAFEQIFECPELLNSENPQAQGSFCSSLRSVKPNVVFYHKLPRLPSLPGELKHLRQIRMIHDHDLTCPTSFKYFRQSGRVCCHKADWRCYFDAAFITRDPLVPLGVRWSSIPKKIGEMRRNYGLDLILTNSQFMREECIQNGFPAEKVRVLHPVLAAGNAPVTPVPESPLVLYVGQLIRGKGVDLFLRALARVQTPFRARIAGTGNAGERLKKLACKLGIADHIEFLGWRPHESLSELYQQAKVVVFPSRWPEPFGLVGVEAMRYGRPVVAFDVGGVRDWLVDNETGYLVPEQDIQGMSVAIGRLLKDTPLAQKLGTYASAYAEEHLTFEKHMKALEGYLQQDSPQETGHRF